MTTAAKLTAHAAIEFAAATGGQLHKYNDPTEDARDIDLDEAREIAKYDPTLVWCGVPATTRAGYLELAGDQAADFETRSLSIGRDMLPACAVGVLDGEQEPGSVYWAWLSTQFAAE